MTITEFLAPRLDEDEAVARQELADGYGDTDRTESGWSSGRVLAEVEAKRRIVEEHTCRCPDPNCGDCGACSGGHHADPTPAPCRTLRLLALPYADHPDYDEAWRP